MNKYNVVFVSEYFPYERTHIKTFNSIMETWNYIDKLYNLHYTKNNKQPMCGKYLVKL